jgi:hypothetical protein
MTIGKRRFEVHKAQKVAAALLLIYLLQALWLIGRLPLNMAETRNAFAGQSLWSSHRPLGSRSPVIPGDSILSLRCAGLLPAAASYFEVNRYAFSVYSAPSRWMVRLPFLAFGAWLGGALWWVARRIFGNEGGYIALGLYCLSPPILLASATADSSILTAWGLFGLIFTAIGVAHTLYAPAAKWRPRILLLGTAIGLTATANLAAGVAGLAMALGLMFYLAPGRRLTSLLILTASTAIGACIFLFSFGFNLRDLSAADLFPNSEYLRFTFHRIESFLAVPGAMLEVFAFTSMVAVFVLWRHARYFGNAAPLMVALFLACWPGEYLPGASIAWTLPFALLFIGGIYADLLEPRFLGGRFRKHVATTAFMLIAANAILSLMLVASA